MAQTYAGTWKAQISDTYVNALDLANITDALALIASQTWTSGTGSGQANCLWHDQRTLLTTTAEDLDLAGSLVNAFGTVTFTKVKGILIQVVTATTGYKLQVGGDANSVPIFGAVGDFIEIGASGIFLWIHPVDGVTVTPNTGDILQIYNPSGGSVTYKIAILGVGTVA